MPIDALHKRKFKTNMAILGAIGVWIVLIWAITMVKISGQ